ncbi:hypothetical protein [Streptomyces sp. NPDC006309]|uniref:beta family protein n=1 Tax=Streptomyces sp. NPDC006309 TaxID=3156749 RepID=UPI0033BA22B6
MGAVLDDRPDAAKEALRALDALMPLAVRRSATPLGGGLSRITADKLEGGACEQSTAEWRMWQEAHATGRAYAPLLGYGDYGVQHPSVLAQAPAPGRKGGPPWGVLHYTTDSSHVLVRTLTRAPTGSPSTALRPAGSPNCPSSGEREPDRARNERLRERPALDG